MSLEDRNKNLLDEWKKEIGDIPEPTCPKIDKGIEATNNIISELEYLEKNAHQYETVDEMVKDFPSYGFGTDTEDIFEDVRSDNERLREIGEFWYSKCKELLNLN